MSKIAETNEKIAQKVVEGCKKIETGVVGGVIASLAYPVYQAIVKAKRKKLAPEILQLSEELMK